MRRATSRALPWTSSDRPPLPGTKPKTAPLFDLRISDSVAGRSISFASGAIAAVTRDVEDRRRALAAGANVIAERIVVDGIVHVRPSRNVRLNGWAIRSAAEIERTASRRSTSGWIMRTGSSTVAAAPSLSSRASSRVAAAVVTSSALPVWAVVAVQPVGPLTMTALRGATRSCSARVATHAQIAWRSIFAVSSMSRPSRQRAKRSGTSASGPDVGRRRGPPQRRCRHRRWHRAWPASIVTRRPALTTSSEAGRTGISAIRARSSAAVRPDTSTPPTCTPGRVRPW